MSFGSSVMTQVGPMPVGGDQAEDAVQAAYGPTTTATRHQASL
jgi:hypothetical protein